MPFGFYIVHMCFLENENVFYNVRITKSIFMVLLSIWMFSAQLEHGVYGRGMSKIQLHWPGWAEEWEVCMLDHRKC